MADHGSSTTPASSPTEVWAPMHSGVEGPADRVCTSFIALSTLSVVLTRRTKRGVLCAARAV